MAKGNDWLPKQRAGQLEMAQNWNGAFASKAAGWNIPAAEVTAFGALVTTADAALAATKGAGRGPVATEACKEAFKALAAKMRALKNNSFNVPPLTNEDLVALGLTPKDNTRSPIAPPTGNPGFEMVATGPRRLTIRLWDEDTGEKRRPYGMVGAVIRYVIADAPVTDIAAFTQSDLITKSPYVFTGVDAQRGKWLSAAMCWQSETGAKGPWSDIVSELIP